MLKRVVQFLLLVLVVNIFAYWTYQHFTEAAREQRNLLYSRFQSLNKSIDTINTTISQLYGNEDLMYAKLGLAVPDTSMKEMGFGGPVLPDSLLVRSASSLKRLKSSMADRISRTEAKIDRTHNSYLSLQLYMEQLHGKLQHTPSIWPSEGYLSSPFGTRTHPVTGEKGKMHYGVDVSAPKWTPIRASANGRIERVANSETLGKHVIIDHGNGIETRYGHMIKPFAKEGQMVKRFDIIGYMGSTGRATGSHLHYEVWFNGAPVNPIYYMLSDQYSVE
ncbi:MAG: M23 family metallopeptidase [Fibromonadaceae bacterium]|nr:M23 family metallopeptidase [Fibromonadaceae bacterium]